MKPTQILTLIRRILTTEKAAYASFLKLCGEVDARRERFNRISGLRVQAEAAAQSAYNKACATLDPGDFNEFLVAQSKADSFDGFTGNHYIGMSCAVESPAKGPAAVAVIRTATAKCAVMLEKKLLALKAEEDQRAVADGIQEARARAEWLDLHRKLAAAEAELAGYMSHRVAAPKDDPDRERKLQSIICQLKQAIANLQVIEYSTTITLLERELSDFQRVAWRAEESPDPWHVIGGKLRQLLLEEV